jgi:hypothetical protein
MLYAHLDENNIVLNIIDADEDFVASQPGNFAKGCSKGQSPKNYPQKDYTYVEALDAYVPPRPGLKWKLGPNLQWLPPKSWVKPEGEPVPGLYEELMKDSNGKQLYRTVIEGPNKADARKVPLVIVGVCLDTRE